MTQMLADRLRRIRRLACEALANLDDRMADEAYSVVAMIRGSAGSLADAIARWRCDERCVVPCAVPMPLAGYTRAMLRRRGYECMDRPEPAVNIGPLWQPYRPDMTTWRKGDKVVAVPLDMTPATAAEMLIAIGMAEGMLPGDVSEEIEMMAEEP